MSFVAVAIGGSALLGVGGALIGANASSNAAKTQSSAANYAADLQAQTANNSLLYQGALTNSQIQNQQPWYQSGTGALSQLDRLMGITPGTAASGVNVPQLGIGNGTTSTNGGITGGTAGGTTTGTTSGFNPKSNLIRGTAQAGAGQSPQLPGALQTGTPQAGAPGATAVGTTGGIATDAQGNPTGGAASTSPLLQGWNQTFQAPTAVTEQNDPGYQFRLQQGQAAMDKSAAASGNLLTGGTANAEQQFGQNYGSNEYNNVYNRSLQNYDTNYNTFEANQANQYNRLASIAGMGQTSASQLNSALGTSGSNVATTMGNAATNIGNQANNAAAATASGYVGSANAYTSGLSNLGSTASSYAQYNQLQNLLNANNSSQIPTGSSALMSTL